VPGTGRFWRADIPEGCRNMPAYRIISQALLMSATQKLTKF
jgi:hypothetical protein